MQSLIASIPSTPHSLPPLHTSHPSSPPHLTPSLPSTPHSLSPLHPSQLSSPPPLTPSLPSTPHTFPPLHPSQPPSPPRAITVKLSVTETDLVVAEDLSRPDSSAIVMKVSHWVTKFVYIVLYCIRTCAQCCILSTCVLYCIHTVVLYVYNTVRMCVLYSIHTTVLYMYALYMCACL